MPHVSGIRARAVAALRSGEEAGRDPTAEVTSNPYPALDQPIERRLWVRGFTRGRVLAKLPAPSEVGELVDEASTVDPARRAGTA